MWCAVVVLSGRPDAFGFEHVVELAAGSEVIQRGVPAMRPRSEVVDFAGP